MEFYTEQYILAARKPHRCHICGAEIPAGCSYYRESGKYAGDFFDRCTCGPCYKIRNDYLSFYEEYEYCNDNISCYAQEMVCYDCPVRETCSIREPLTCQTVKDFYIPKEE